MSKEQYVNKELKIDNKYLDELISLVSGKLVGKSMKRFEIFNNIGSIKADIKELIYESYRDFRDLLEAHNEGINVTIFKFKSKDNLTHKQ